MVGRGLSLRSQSGSFVGEAIFSCEPLNRPVTQPTPTSTGRSVLLAGATGLVGAEVLRHLIDDRTVGRIVVVGRRAVSAADPRVESRIIDFDHLDASASLFAVGQIICALGTTIRQAGSEDAFRRVDFDYPLAMAHLGLKQGARHFLVVSALGANAESRIFYSRVKGELEDRLRSIGYRSVTIVRPSLLLGKRDEFRLLERVGMVLGEIVPGRYRPVHASAVAETLVTAARLDAPGLHIIESEEIRTGVTTSPPEMDE